MISNFIIQALKNKDITIYGDGTQTRSFQYIDDLIIAMLSIMDSDNELFGPINIGNPIEISVYDLALKIINLTKSKSKIVFGKLPMDDPKRRNPDISLAKIIISWNPDTDLQHGLKNTIEYFKTVI